MKYELLSRALPLLVHAEYFVFKFCYCIFQSLKTQISINYGPNQNYLWSIQNHILAQWMVVLSNSSSLFRFKEIYRIYCTSVC